MNPVEKALKFQTDLADLVERHVNGGCSVNSMISTLANTEFEMRIMLLNARQEQVAKAMSRQIVPATILPTAPQTKV